MDLEPERPDKLKKILILSLLFLALIIIFRARIIFFLPFFALILWSAWKGGTPWGEGGEDPADWWKKGKREEEES